MLSPRSLLALVALSLPLSSVTAQEIIARCPTEETTLTLTGQAFHVCSDTDIRGVNARQVKDVADTAACAALCAADDACAQATYRKPSRTCQIKAPARTTMMVWRADEGYDTIQRQVERQPATEGAWSDMIALPVIPVAAYVAPAVPLAERVMFFSSWGEDTFGGSLGFKTQFADYNHASGKASKREVADTNHDMFCPGISSLEDGRIMISGGGTSEATTFYDPAKNTFTRGPNMTEGRGYHSSVTLSDGRVFAIGGAYSGERKSKDGEIFDPVENTWTSLPGAQVKPMLTADLGGPWRSDNHAWLYAWTNGSVFQAGPSKKQHWYGTDGDGSVEEAGTRDTQDAMCGVNVMYEPGKILSAGGSPQYSDSDALAKAHVTTITGPGEKSTVTEVSDMNYPRGFANAVVLPDGQVLVTGGMMRVKTFNDETAQLFPEMYNPKTENWTVMAPEAVPRTYHSASILLADATVWSGGGGLCWVRGPGTSEDSCNKMVDHADGQIFSPPYLFDDQGKPAKRPAIFDVAKSSIQVGGNVIFSVDAPDADIVLVRIGSATHSTNTDQRRIPLGNVDIVGQRYRAALPDDSGILLPGHYFLFALAEGVPSVAQTIQITL